MDNVDLDDTPSAATKPAALATSKYRLLDNGSPLIIDGCDG